MNPFPKWYIIQSFCFQFHKNNNDINVKVNEHFKSKCIFKYTQNDCKYRGQNEMWKI